MTRAGGASEIELNYRLLYGRLFARLLTRFGPSHIPAIEDALQNAFYKSIRAWKPGSRPNHPERWLYTVAKNDLLNQIKRDAQRRKASPPSTHESTDVPDVQHDLRLNTIIQFADIDRISSRAKILFLLKNIFGLSVKEISQCTIMSHEAVYKMLARTRKQLRPTDFETDALSPIRPTTLAVVHELLYAIFNIGFDSFRHEKPQLVDDDICMEALALAKNLHEVTRVGTTRNLIALFCFHLARISGRTKDNRLVSFFQQERSTWNTSLIHLGLHFLEKPAHLDPYYLEAIIASKHMTTQQFDLAYWQEIIDCYELLTQLKNSPIIKINLAYCLHQAGQTAAALTVLEEIESALPRKHFYYSLVKAEVLKEQRPEVSKDMLMEALQMTDQSIRREYLKRKMT